MIVTILENPVIYCEDVFDLRWLLDNSLTKIKYNPSISRCYVYFSTDKKFFASFFTPKKVTHTVKHLKNLNSKILLRKPKL